MGGVWVFGQWGNPREKTQRAPSFFFWGGDGEMRKVKVEMTGFVKTRG